VRHTVLCHVEEEFYERVAAQAARIGCSVPTFCMVGIADHVAASEAREQANQRKAAKEPKLHSDFLGKRNIFAVMDGTIPQPSALAAKEPKP